MPASDSFEFNSLKNIKASNLYQLNLYEWKKKYNIAGEPDGMQRLIFGFSDNTLHLWTDNITKVMISGSV